jgi:hypothetical protein
MQYVPQHGLRHTEQQRAEAKGYLCQVIRALLQLEALNIMHRYGRNESEAARRCWLPPLAVFAACMNSFVSQACLHTTLMLM